VVVGGHDVYFVFDRVQAVQRSECFGAVGVEETAWVAGRLADVVDLVGARAASSGCRR